MAFVALPAPYDFQLSTSRFRAYGLDLANLWVDEALWRVAAGKGVRIAAAGGAGVDEPGRSQRAGIDVEPHDPAVEAEVRRLLGAQFDLDGFAAFVAAAGDPVLAGLHARFRGFRPPLAPDPYEALVTAITAQQVSLRSAFAVRNRLIAAYGEPSGPPLGAGGDAGPEYRLHAFPRAERLAGSTPEALLPLGFSRQKAEYVVGLARAMPGLAGLAAVPDDEVKARLLAVRGLGEWTADWFLARHLARPQAWPAGDLVLRKACSRFYAEGRELSIGEVRLLGERFAPFQNLTAHLLLLGATIP